MKRADVNVLVSWVVTLPTRTEYSEELEYTPEQQRSYFEACYDMMADRYGRENVVSSYVHLDETTPHMHFAFVPVTADRAWNKKHPDRPRDKVSAKEVLTRTDLQTFHPELQQHLDGRSGRGFYPVLNGATEGGNRSIMELKALRAAEQLAEVEQDLWIAQQDLQGVKVDLQHAQDALETAGEALSAKLDEIQELEPRATALEDDIQALEARRSDLRGGIQELQEQIGDLTEVITKKKSEAREIFGSDRGYREAIRQKREADAKDLRTADLEAYVAQPDVKADFETWRLQREAGQSRGKRRSSQEIGR